MNYIKALLVGSTGCGKSAWLERFHTGQFRVQHITGPDTWHLNFGANHFEIAEQRYIFNDMSECQVVFIMFDLTNPESYKAAELCKERVEMLKKPIVFIGTKTDHKNAMDVKKINLHRGTNYPIWLISAKSQHNFDKPLVAAERVRL